MKISIKTKNLKLSSALKDFIEEKINSLEKFSKIFYDKEYSESFLKKARPKVEAWVEVGKETMHHQKGEIFYADCRMRFFRNNLSSEVRAKNVRSAICQVRDDLQRELKRDKEKITSQTKRRARALKKDLKLSPAARFYRKGRIREEGV